MPYKHIAAHLNKTELACRLHYHQLSHGSGRRKRATSGSPGSDRSPSLAASAPSPAGSLSPPRPYDHYIVTPPTAHDVHLPSIVSHHSSPRVHGILPKPNAMAFGSRANSPPEYVPATPESRHRTPLPPLTFSSSRSPGGNALQISAPPRGEASFPSSSTHTPSHVDLSRLQAVYESHRNKFWDAIAYDYGYQASPSSLEKAWKTGRCCSPVLPPLASPKEDERFPLPGRDKTRISSILDSDPFRGGRRL